MYYATHQQNEESNEQLLRGIESILGDLEKDLKTTKFGSLQLKEAQGKLAILLDRANRLFHRWEHMDPQPKKIDLMWQGIVDGTNEAFLLDNDMMVIGGADGVTYLTRSQAEEIFNLGATETMENIAIMARSGVCSFDMGRKHYVLKDILKSVEKFDPLLNAAKKVQNEN